MAKPLHLVSREIVRAHRSKRGECPGCGRATEDGCKAVETHGGLSTWHFECYRTAAAHSERSSLLSSSSRYRTAFSGVDTLHGVPTKTDPYNERSASHAWEPVPGVAWARRCTCGCGGIRVRQDTDPSGSNGKIRQTSHPRDRMWHDAGRHARKAVEKAESLHRRATTTPKGTVTAESS